MTRLHLNRDDELKAFAAILAGTRLESALWVNGESGSGKTSLLTEFRRLARETGRITVLIDFKGGSTDVFMILAKLCDGLGPHDFPTCRQALSQRQVRVDPTISGNMGLGRTEIHQTIHLSTFSLEEQRRQTHHCTTTFFDELRRRSAPAPVLLFDTCQDAPPDTLAWLWNLFLFLADPQRTPGLVVVVAGQRLPEPGSEWTDYCCRFHLSGLQPDLWCDYAQRIQAPLSEETVRAFHTRFQGLPAEMVNTLGMFAPRAG